ncbi:transposase [Clostridium tagluense]|uniref:transposase n=1 Tax=Clostridium tagluense TaxID=360422 RepID=UPI001CF49AB6|nr:transposase [Clostridium tagluense]MCB2300296.1 transposase [Clostridium tagluense]
MEELYYKKLNEEYSSQGRKPAVEPKTLFKILVYAYMNDIYSSRKIEKACKRDINFMWRLQGRKAPNHNIIARFRSKRLVGVVDDLFNQFVEKLKTYGQVEWI